MEQTNILIIMMAFIAGYICSHTMDSMCRLVEGEEPNDEKSEPDNTMRNVIIIAIVVLILIGIGIIVGWKQYKKKFQQVKFALCVSAFSLFWLHNPRSPNRSKSFLRGSLRNGYRYGNHTG